MAKPDESESGNGSEPSAARVRGDADRWTDADIAALAEIQAREIEAADALWRAINDGKVNMLDAEPRDDHGR